MSQAVIWLLVISAIGVVVVRRRLVAIALVALQSLLLGAQAIANAAGESTALLVAGGILLVKAIVLPALLAAVVLRTAQRLISIVALSSSGGWLANAAANSTPALLTALSLGSCPQPQSRPRQHNSPLCNRRTSSASSTSRRSRRCSISTARAAGRRSPAPREGSSAPLVPVVVGFGSATLGRGHGANRASISLRPGFSL